MTGSGSMLTPPSALEMVIRSLGGPWTGSVETLLKAYQEGQSIATILALKPREQRERSAFGLHERVSSSEFAIGPSCATGVRLRHAASRRDRRRPCCCRGVAALQPEWLYGVWVAVARIARGRRSRQPDPQLEPGSAPSSFTMKKEPSTYRWRIQAMTVLQRVTAAERRFSASVHVNRITMLAAADELEAATGDAREWVVANPCPNPKLGAHIAWLLGTCTEVALTAQRAVAGPFADTELVMGRLGDLLAVIDFHSETLDAW